MNPAKLDTKVTLSRKVTSRDASGAPIETFQTIADVRAEKAEQGSVLFREFGLLQAETTTVFTVRYISIPERDFVIIEDAVKYKLTVPPYEVDGRKRFLRMQARRLE